jgi:signal transduction histidine kinase
MGMDSNEPSELGVRPNDVRFSASSRLLSAVKSFGSRALSVSLVARPEEHARPHVQTIKQLVEGTVRVVRNMALLLGPSMLDDLGLIPALKWQDSRRSRPGNAVATLDCWRMG